MASENDQPSTEQHDQNDQAQPAQPTTPEAPAEAAPAPAKKAARKRAPRKATAPVAAPEPHTDEPSAAGPAEGSTEPAPASAKRTRARKSAKATTPAAVEPEAPAAETSEPATDEPAPAPRRRKAAATTAKRGSRRRATDADVTPAEPDAASQAAAVVDEQALRFDALEAPSGTPDASPSTDDAPSGAGALGPLFQAPVAVPSDEEDDEKDGQDEESDAASADPAEPSEPTEPSDDAEPQESRSGDAPRRRRRRGGKGRRSRAATPQDREADASAADAGADEPGDANDAPSDQGGEPSEGSTSRRRTRRRRRSGSADGDHDEPGVTTKVRESRRDEVTALKGSTRLEAKKQRRREGREAGRRRTVITEAEFLARRESVERVMVVRRLGERTQIGVLEDGVLVEHYISKETNVSMAGNIYLGRVQNVLPSMEAAFVDIGKGRNAVLYAGEVNWDAAGLESGQPKRIENALSSGESVLVQVTKDPIGHKGARLTSQISLPGRYLVYVPNSSMTGISRKLPDTERSRLKKILKEVVPDTAGVIVRTAAEGASEEELRADVARLTQAWDEISAQADAGASGSGSGKKKNKGGNAPQLLHGEPDLTVRVIRDIFNEDFASLVVAGDEAWQEVSEYVSSVAPDLAERIHKWTSEDDLFTHYRVDEQIAKAMDRKVWLPSGGSLVIDRTEAMTVVDVNTGKFIGSGGNLEETVTKNNLEAAEEIVRQLRLRDVGGIIVIDFIDMVLESNRDLVVRRLLECLGRDRTKHQVAEVTSLGLVQMTRKRVGSGLIEVFSETCEACAGRGIIIHSDPVDKGGSVQHEHVDTGSRSSGGSASRGRSRGGSRPAEAPAPPRPGGPTPAQIAAAAHAAAVKNAGYAGEPASGDHQDGPLDVVQEIDLAEIELILPPPVSEPEPETEPVSEPVAEPQTQPETDPAAEPESEPETPAYPQDEVEPPAPTRRPRRHRGRVVAPAGPPRAAHEASPSEAGEH